MANTVKHLFMCLWPRCMSSLEKCLFIFLAHFKVGLFVFFITEFLSICLAVAGLDCSTQGLWSSLWHAEPFSRHMWALSHGMWGLGPQPEIKPEPPAVGGQSLSHETPGKSLLLAFKSALHILDTSSSSDTRFANIFSHTVDCSHLILVMLHWYGSPHFSLGLF